jgi:hypothetical protein
VNLDILQQQQMDIKIINREAVTDSGFQHLAEPEGKFTWANDMLLKSAWV